MSDRMVTADSLAAGTTSVSLWVEMFVEATDAAVTGLIAANINASYWRQGGLRVAITESDLAAVDSAYSAGGWKEVDATNMPGLYRLDVPDAAFATGADWVVISVVEAGSKTFYAKIALPTYSALRDAIFDHVVESEGSYTAQQALSIILAALGGVTTTFLRRYRSSIRRFGTWASCPLPRSPTSRIRAVSWPCNST
jgi:hypothetical protein